MKFTMPKPGVKSSMLKLEAVILKKKLPVKVKLESTKKGNLLVKISKLGTSKLLFYVTGTVEKTTFELGTESISWWHRNHVDEFKRQLKGIVVDAGGSIG